MTVRTRMMDSGTLGERLVAEDRISAEDLNDALRLHPALRVKLGHGLLDLSLVRDDEEAPDSLSMLPAPACAVPPSDSRLRDLERRLPESVQRRLNLVPLFDTVDALVVATPDPRNQDALAEAGERVGRPIRAVDCTREELDMVMETLHRSEYLHRSAHELRERKPEQSAFKVLTKPQMNALRIMLVAAVASFWFFPAITGVVLMGSFMLFYLVFSLYRCHLIYRGLSHDLEIPVSPEELAALDEAKLPIYTILVPLYREAAVLPTLLEGLARLDYPRDKLDVQILLEADDVETLAAVAVTELPPSVRPVVVPAAEPRGKPKACNYGLLHARGEYVVIFDAEDVPDPDQLKKVVAAFRKVPREVVCLQAKLTYYNANQNLLTRWFSIEYSMWFDLFLPGLDVGNAPVPLGGTSNHFRATRLREVGAWDPYNVTEDADLGIRLSRLGWRTAVLDSSTQEEATSQVFNWIRQRSRWVKGYIQTYLVHMRHPISLWRELGTKGFFSFNMVIGGTFLSFLLNPLLYLLTSLWYLFHPGVLHTLFPAPVFYLGITSLFIGNFTFIYLNLAGCMRPGFYDKVKYALISPLYWALMSWAAWKGFLQLWTKPFYWEKTMHGQYQPDVSAANPADVLAAPSADGREVVA
jgi:cellulose synthase/poly-beta-1,6-N-acetylglucosamine synthase-like glycosyltransferase